MRNLMRYRIISSNRADEFNLELADAQDSSWEVWREIQIESTASDIYFVVQMVKWEDREDK